MLSLCSLPTLLAPLFRSLFNTTQQQNTCTTQVEYCCLLQKDNFTSDVL
jgi:hypothetical protein